jgi:PncC family amidohydrolase
MNIKQIKKKLKTKLVKKKIKLCIAESVTGGRFVYEFVKNKGASDIVDYSLVSYSNDSKIRFLKLNKEIKKETEFSRIVAKGMAENIIKYSKNENKLGISCTGLASISKNSKNWKSCKVFIAANYNKKLIVKEYEFKKLSRIKVIEQTVEKMIMLCNSII